MKARQGQYKYRTNKTTCAEAGGYAQGGEGYGVVCNCVTTNTLLMYQLVKFLVSVCLFAL